MSISNFCWIPHCCVGICIFTKEKWQAKERERLWWNFRHQRAGSGNFFYCLVLGVEVAITAGGIFHSLLSSAKLGKQSHCLLKRHEYITETNVFSFGFLGWKISLVLSGFLAVVPVNRTLLPDILTSLWGVRVMLWMILGSSELSDLLATCHPCPAQVGGV